MRSRDWMMKTNGKTRLTQTLRNREWRAKQDLWQPRAAYLRWGGHQFPTHDGTREIPSVSWVPTQDKDGFCTGLGRVCAHAVTDRAGLPIAGDKVLENKAFQEARLYQFAPE